MERGLDSPGPIAVAIAVVEHEARYLVGRRPPDVPLAGLWEFPGGKIRTGETPELAAARECLEETALEVQVGPLLLEMEHAYEHGRVRLHFFLCRPVDPDAVPRAPFRWVDGGELARLDFPPANAAILRRLGERALPAGPGEESR